MRRWLVALVFAVLVALLVATLWWQLSGSRASANTGATTGTAGFSVPNGSSGDVVWFVAVVQSVGNHPSVVTNVRFTHQVLTFKEPNGSTFSEKLYSAIVTYYPGAATANSTWSPGAFRWETTVPSTYAGDVFLSGFVLAVGHRGIPANTTVTWSGDLTGSGSCLGINWMWGAAVYSKFIDPYSTHNYASIGVKPVDDSKLSAYNNSDLAGTPENFKEYLTVGGTSGGRTSFTGAFSPAVGMNVGSC